MHPGMMGKRSATESQLFMFLVCFFDYEYDWQGDLVLIFEFGFVEIFKLYDFVEETLPELLLHLHLQSISR